jgi:hypothetical protein
VNTNTISNHTQMVASGVPGTQKTLTQTQLKTQTLTLTKTKKETNNM